MKQKKNVGPCCHMVVVECKVLTECKHDTCSFHQTLEQLLESREKAAARLRTLPEDEQAYISDKYYRGKMPWREAPE